MEIDEFYTGCRYRIFTHLGDGEWLTEDGEETTVHEGLDEHGRYVLHNDGDTVIVTEVDLEMKPAIISGYIDASPLERMRRIFFCRGCNPDYCNEELHPTEMRVWLSLSAGERERLTQEIGWPKIRNGHAVFK